MHIIICDDDHYFSAKLERDIKSCFLDSYPETPLHFTIFEKGEELIASKEINTCDLIFLDIIMAGTNGIGTAQAIRQKDKKTPIVFCTSSPDYAITGYSVQAVGYLLKPYTKEQLSSILHSLHDMMGKVGKKITFMDGKTPCTFFLDDIAAFESDGHDLLIHLAGGKEPVTIREKLSTVEESLAGDPRFLRCHQSFIINMDHISKIMDKTFLLDTGYRILIRAKEWNKFVTTYTDYATSFKTLTGSTG